MPAPPTPPVVTDPSVLRGIPELFEYKNGESLAARTDCLQTFRELGPPDLCHVVKTNPKAAVKDIGSYHYVLGVDTSSPATMAAYINTLAMTGDKNSPWKVTSATFCSFNAFSRVDVRVQIRIPGGVDAYLVDLRGENHRVTNPAIWQETFVSSVLRALLDDSDNAALDAASEPPLLGLVKMDPLRSHDDEQRFLDAAQEEFWKGWQLGTVPEVQVATYFSNHLTNGVYNYFAHSQRIEDATLFFEKLYRKDSQVGVILARAYIEINEEIKAVKILRDALDKSPQSYGLLLAQVDFSRKKKRYDLALKLAKLAVTYSPAEYTSWAKLTQLYIDNGDYESALLALNSCPMFTFTEKDHHVMPTPARIFLPLKPPASDARTGSSAGKTTTTAHADDAHHPRPLLNGVMVDENDPVENEVHPELARLPALTLRGTFRQAYTLLILIFSKTGWDELLKFRSNVFVMEDEYRVHRALLEEVGRGEPGLEEVVQSEAIRPTNAAASPTPQVAASPSANTTSSLSPSREASKARLEPGTTRQHTRAESLASNASGGGGRKRFSVGALLKKVESEVATAEVAEAIAEDHGDLDAGEPSGNTPTSAKAASPAAPTPSIKSPTKSPARIPNPRPPKHNISFSFKSKRLCEKWLDNLFMVLYSDLRIYTAFKQEITHLKSQDTTSADPLLYRKSGSEWEIYGDLCHRLLHFDDAKEAYKLCAEQKYSNKSLLNLYELLCTAGDTIPALTLAARLVNAADRHYNKAVYPSAIARGMFKLFARHGCSKVQNYVQSLRLDPTTFKLLARYFEYAELFRVSGSNW